MRALRSTSGLVVALTFAATLPAVSTATSALAVAPAAASPASPASWVSPAELAAMGRDLNLSTDQVRGRLATDRAAMQAEKDLHTSLGGAFGGAWISRETGKLVVGVTKASLTGRVKAGGGSPTLVKRGLRELTALKARLDRNASLAPKSVPGWYVDVTSNSVTVLAHPGTEAAARTFIDSTGLSDPAVKVVTSSETPQTRGDVIGGNALTAGVPGCSVGFAVNGGFITAGHCVTPFGNSTQPQGTVAGTSFPGNDYAWVQVAPGETPRGFTSNGNNSASTVLGSVGVFPVGAIVCRSGAATGVRCGTILAKDVTVNYPQGAVMGLTRTSACSATGDSGGPFHAQGQAQGVMSGGSGNCNNLQDEDISTFNPIAEILTAYGLSLVTELPALQQWWWLTGAIAGTMSVVSLHEDHLQVFGRGVDNALYTNRFDTRPFSSQADWTGWQPLGGYLTSDPTAVLRGGTIEVFVRGLDNGVYRRYLENGNWYGYEALGGDIKGNVTAVSLGPDNVELFARGSDDTLQWNAFNGGMWSGWQTLPAVLTSDPVAVTRGGIVDVFVRGGDNTVYWLFRENSAWVGFIPLGQTFVGTPAAVSLNPSHLEVLVRGTDNMLYANRFDGTYFTGWQNLGGTIISDPAAIARGPAIDVYGRGPDSTVRRRYFDGSSWQPWSTLAGRAATRPAVGSRYVGQSLVFHSRLGNLEPFFRYSY